MIIKIKSRKTASFRQLLRYMIEGEERVPESRVLLHNLKGRDISAWVKEFEVNESYRKRKRKNSTILTHEILSWHPKDAKYLTVAKIEDLTREYIRNRNPKGLYVGAIHQAKNHYHVHLCVSGVEYKSGTVMRMSRGRLKEVKKELERFQKERFPDLVYSRCGGNRSKENIEKLFRL